MRTCPDCGEQSGPSARFCGSCGAAFQRVCPSCGGAAGDGAFCEQCGSPQSGAAVRAAPEPPPAVAAERRVTSVLFGDLVGFTALSENRDAEDVRELLSQYFTQCRTIVSRYGGIVEKFIGDAVMAVWGVPVAHEDDAERAVRAGLELVQAVSAMGDDLAVPSLAMRVGVVTGEVAVTVGATAEGMVAGDAVNTASRVQSVAEPGQVWVDDATRGLTSAAVTYVDVGEHGMKGKSLPLRLWRARAVVSDVGGDQRVDGLEAPLVARNRDLRLVKELFHATEEAGRPRLLVVDGVPGVGKSRLAWEFEKYVDGLTATVRWHRGRCLSYGEGVAFWALAEAVRTRLGLVESGDEAVTDETLDRALEEYVPDPEERAWLRPRVAVLIGLEPAAGQPRGELFAAWVAFLEAVSSGAPVVLVLEDAQYADDGLLDFLDHLLSTARAPVFVLALARPELLHRRPDLGGRRTTVIHLEPLADQDMAHLLDGLVVGLPEQVRVELIERAEGIPLFAVETVRALIDRDAVVPKDGEYVPATGVDIDLSSIGAPATLHALVAARLDALSAAERLAVADASVLGASFTMAGLQALGGDGASLDGVLESLQRKEVFSLERDRFSAERGQYRFVQSVVRQVAYSTQSRRDRKARHLAAATFLAEQAEGADELAVVVAQHLLDAVDASGRTDDDAAALTDRARSLLETAADRAGSLGSPHEALRLLVAALDRTEPRLDRARLQLKAAEAAEAAGDLDAAARHADEAVTAFDALQMPIEAARAVSVQAAVASSLLDNTAARELALSRWDSVSELPGAEAAVIALGRRIVSAAIGLGLVDESAPYLQRVLLAAEAVRDAEALATALAHMSLRFLALGAPETSLILLADSVEVARDNDLPGRLSLALNNLGSSMISRDLGAAVDYLREAVEAARRSGIPSQQEYTTFNLALALWTVGELTEARGLVEQLDESGTDPSIRLITRSMVAWVAEAYGLPLPEPLDVETIDSEADLAWQADLAIRLLTAEGRHAEAAALTETSLHHIRAISGLDDDFITLWPPLVLAALEGGDVGLAERLMEPVETAPLGVLTPAVAAQHRRLRGLLSIARGSHEDVEGHLLAAIEQLAAVGAVTPRTQAQAELGRWLVDQGRVEEGEALLDQVRASYAERGTQGWLARLDGVRTG